MNSEEAGRDTPPKIISQSVPVVPMLYQSKADGQSQEVWYAEPQSQGTDGNVLSETAIEKQLHFGELSDFLAYVRAEERKQISRELHDTVAQSLCLAELLLDKAYQSENMNVKPQLDQVSEVLREAYNELIEISGHPRPSISGDRGLVSVVELLITRFTSQTGMNIKFDHDGAESPFPREITDAAYWIVLEALNNVVRHAKVTDASVELHGSAGRLQVHVKDYGCGFEPAVVSASSSGLRGIRERVIRLDGRLEIDSAPGCGTIIIAELPFSDDVYATDSRLQYASHQNQLPLF